MNCRRLKNENHETVTANNGLAKNSLKENVWNIQVSQERIKTEKIKIDPEDYDYQPDCMHQDLEEADSYITLDDFPDECFFGSEILFRKLANELNMQMIGNIEKDKRTTTRINLLKKSENYFTGPELLAIDFCISGYASVCGSAERKKEILRTLFLVQVELKSFKIDKEIFSRKIEKFDTRELFELTEIILNSRVILGCVGEADQIMGHQSKNKRLDWLHAKLNEFSSRSDNERKGRDPSKQIKVQSVCITSKIYDYLMTNPAFQLMPNGFCKNDSLQQNFKQSLSMHLQRSLLAFQDAHSVMRFEDNSCTKNIIEESASEYDAITIKDLLNKFLINESKKVRDKTIGYYASNIRFDDTLHNFASYHDYSIIAPIEQIENFTSTVFDIENWDLVVHYYLEYIYYFPISIEEFEKTLFLFLLYATKKDNKSEIVTFEIFDLKVELNKVLQSKYIRMKDEFILILFYVFSFEPELEKIRDENFQRVKKIIDLLIKQAYSNY